MKRLKAVFRTTIFRLVAVVWFYGYLRLIDGNLLTNLFSQKKIIAIYELEPSTVSSMSTEWMSDEMCQQLSEQLTQLQQQSDENYNVILNSLSTIAADQSTPSISNDELTTIIETEATTEKDYTVQLFYFNEQVDSELPSSDQLNRSSVLPIQRRITATSTENLIEETLTLLIAGTLTDNEKALGFVTDYPQQWFSLEKVELGQFGTLTVRFTELPWFTSGGSARMILIRDAIEKTVLQFADVTEVVYEPKGLFQP